MTGFNLPPGCNISDIPGNRPEDLAEEAFCDSLYERFIARFGDDPAMRRIIENVLENQYLYAAVTIARDLGMREGFSTLQAKMEKKLDALIDEVKR